MSKTEYLIWQRDTSLHLYWSLSKTEYLIWWRNVIRRYISTGPKRKWGNNTDVIDYFAGDNGIYDE